MLKIKCFREHRGLMFSQNPITGEDKLYGFLFVKNSVKYKTNLKKYASINLLKRENPTLYKKLFAKCILFEQEKKDAICFEYANKNNFLMINNVFVFDRSEITHLRIMYNLVKKGVIPLKEAASKINIDAVAHIFPTNSRKDMKGNIIGRGLKSTSAVIMGRLLFDAKNVRISSNKNCSYILAVPQITPEDIQHLNGISGIISIRGGITSHSAIIARELGILSIFGSGDMTILKNKLIGEKIEAKKGDFVTLDGSTGIVYKGKFNNYQKKEDLTNCITDKIYQFLENIRDYKKEAEFNENT
jgi:pyruvate,orthophosphate dikinase